MRKVELKVGAVAQVLVEENPHEKAKNGLSSYKPEGIQTVLGKFKSISNEMYLFGLLAFLILRNGTLRYKNYASVPWKKLLPQNVLSDLVADVLLLRHLLDKFKLETPEELTAEISQRKLASDNFTYLQMNSLNTTSSINCLFELAEMVRLGLSYKLPSCEKFDQGQFTQVITEFMMNHEAEAYTAGATSSMLRRLDRTTGEGQLELNGSILFGKVQDYDIVLFHPQSHTFMLVAANVRPSQEADVMENLLAYVKAEVDSGLFDLDWRNLSANQVTEVEAKIQAPKLDVCFDEVELPAVPDQLSGLFASAVKRIQNSNQELQRLKEMFEQASTSQTTRNELSRRQAELEAERMRLEKLYEDVTSQLSEVTQQLEALVEVNLSVVAQQAEQLRSESLNGVAKLSTAILAVQAAAE